MVEAARQTISDADLAAARLEVRRGVRGLVGALLGIVLVTGVAAGVVAAAIIDAPVWETVLAVGGASIVIGFPMVLVLFELTRKRGLDIALETVVQARVLETEACRREFESRPRTRTRDGG